MSTTTRRSDFRPKKPRILSQLESSCQEISCLMSGQKLSAIELIIFVFNVLKNKLNTDLYSIKVKDLYLLVKQFMGKQLAAISGQKCQQMDHNCGQQTRQSEDNEIISFNNLLTDFIESKILSINLNKQTIRLNSDSIAKRHQWLTEVQQMLDNCLITSFQNYLTTQLERFGERRVDDIEMRLIRSHNYLFQYLFSDKTNYRLIDFTQSKPEQFSMRYINHCSQTDAIVDINSSLRSPEKHVFSCVNKKSYSLIGFVNLLDQNNRCIVLKKQTIDSNHDFHYKIDSNLIEIYGHKVFDEELLQWIHTNDLVVFDAQQIKHNDNPMNNRYSVHNSWFVTSISKIQHLGHCFSTEEQQFSHFQWQ